MIHPRHPDFRDTPVNPARPYGSFRPADEAAPPGVSVVTPWFNVGAVFHETAESLFRQTFQQWEWLIVNDGSTDPAALKELETYRRGGDRRIRVIDLAANAGPSAARNRGVAEARAPFVFHLDADDLIEPTAIEKCYWYLLTHPRCPWVNGWSVAFGADRYLWRKGFDEAGRFLSDNWVTGRAMVRVTAHREIGGYDEDIRGGYEDWAFWLKGAQCGLWGGTLPEFFDWYRQREDHWQRWENLSEPKRRESFRTAVRARFARLRPERFPGPLEDALEDGVDPACVANRLRGGGRSIIFVLSASTPLTPELEIFLGAVLSRLARDGHGAILIDPSRPSQGAMEALSVLTPQAYRLAHFLPEAHFASFFRYVLESREPGAIVWFGESSPGVLMPGDGKAPKCAQFLLGGGSSGGEATGEEPAVTLYLRTAGVDGAGRKALTIRRGIDAVHWQRDSGIRLRVRDSLGWPRHSPVLLLPAALAEALVPALDRLAQSGRACRFLYFGPDSARTAALPHLGERGHGCSAQLSPVESLDQMRDLLCAADLLLVPAWPSAEEPLALLAAAMGLTLLAPVHGAPAWLPEEAFQPLKAGESGCTMSDSLAASLAPLLDDPDRLRERGRAARALVERQLPVQPALDHFLARILPPN
ncbi:MAG: glycosyltransferase family 2 protein [Opitutales bacterium]|nr:glycosyltransferase family 2 protein [Opitutales bacterium]